LAVSLKNVLLPGNDNEFFVLNNAISIQMAFVHHVIKDSIFKDA